MRAWRSIVPTAALTAAVLVASCGDGSTPSSVPSPAAPSASPASTPTPTPSTPRLSPDLVGVWNLSLRITEATGVGCVAETFRARIGEPDAYSLSIRDTGQVTISSPADGLSCSFTAKADGDNGFTTYGVPGFYTCVGEPRTYKCADGTERRYYSFGQDIDGKVSGGRITGTWMVFWYDVTSDALYVEAKAQFSGVK